jgi:hypothetical protein
MREKIKQLIIGNYKIYRLDKRNLVIEEYRDVEDKSTKEVSKKWVDCGVYFVNLGEALNWVLRQKIPAEDAKSIQSLVGKLEGISEKLFIAAKGIDVESFEFEEHRGEFFKNKAKK